MRRSHIFQELKLGILLKKFERNKNPNEYNTQNINNIKDILITKKSKPNQFRKYSHKYQYGKILNKPGACAECCMSPRGCGFSKLNLLERTLHLVVASDIYLIMYRLNQR